MEEEPPESFQLRRGQKRGRRSRQITEESLRDLDSKEPSDVLLSLSHPKSGLEDCLKNVSLKASTIKILLSVLGKGCKCESMKEQQIYMLNVILRSQFITITLIQYLASMNEASQDKMEKSLMDCLPLVRLLLVTMPTEGLKKVQVIAVMLEQIWLNTDKRNNELQKEMEQMRHILHKTKPPEIEAREPHGAHIAALDNGDPPENFRELPVMPRKGELDGSHSFFLRSNRVSQRYENLEQYLDIQFRLFRADYIIPLRENIEEYQAQMINERGQSGSGYRVYDDVQIVRPVCTHNGLCYRLAFDISRMHKVKWESTRRLMYGSLLCLSSDNFQNCFLFATVDQSDKENLKNGMVDVLFEEDLETIADVPRDKRFTMVESSAYFESYKHVLRGMQQLHDRNFPFQKYIVSCNPDVDPPQYLHPEVTYDLRPLVDDDYVLGDGSESSVGQNVFSQEAECATHVPVTKPEQWPTPQTLHLDMSQFQAIQNALTKEFAIVQGPPGTGKTYIGLKILKALLHNSHAWVGAGERSPIVVVCYTNHALDQFLEGILKNFKGNLIRVGSRSKSESLQEYSLRNLRQRARENRNVPLEVHANKLETMREMTSLKSDIHSTAVRLEVAEREILHERCLFDYMTKTHHKNFTDRQSSDTSFIIFWLGLHERLEWTEHVDKDRSDEESDEDEEDEEPIDVTDMVQNTQHQRMLEEDLIDILDDENLMEDLREKLDKVDVESIRVHTECIGLDVTQLDISCGTYSHFSAKKKAEWEEKRKRKRILKNNIQKKIRSMDRMTEREAGQIPDIWRLRRQDRWRLYRYWVDLFCRQAKGEIRDKETEYKRISNRYRETLLQEDKAILRKASIVGMTTTAAARYQSILQEIRPKIIIVEEAAEVLEAHVTATLSQGCQHLILIGDHQQLRPNPTVHELAKKYNLDISLFERLVNCGLHPYCLEWQHRMRPEISKVISHIYPSLKDHETVKSYEQVSGIACNLYFVDHQYPHTADEETKSYANEQEANYVVALCKYLLKQGFSRQRITILTPYSAQLHFIQSLMPKSQFEGVRVAVVDGFQGEENDIILLSLVRSGHPEESIGFLKTDNRICVALSRAKVGMYVVGNFSYLCEQSSLLKKVAEMAKQDNIIGPGLPLFCQNHPREVGLEAVKPEDFQRVPEGGCLKPCEYRLPCGHACPKTCHVTDREHTNYTCYENCARQCKNGHTCQSMCFNPCPPCTVLMPKVLPRCGHTQMVPCGTEPHLFQCEESCQSMLDCGHQCTALCGQPHSICVENHTVARPCGHTIEVACHEKESSPCSEPCRQELFCEHICGGTCGTCFRGRLHELCTQPCNKILVCGHICQEKCCNCPPCQRECENRCAHTKCPKKCGEPCVPCNMPCAWHCKHYTCTKLCGQMCNRQRCNEPCRKQLPCKHLCIGLCGEPCPVKCRICDKEEVTALFFGEEDEPNARFIQLEDCSHIVEMHGMDRWMDGPCDSSEDKVTVQLKGCPKCKTPIRRNLRYGNIIKESMNNIVSVKRKVIGNEKQVKEMEEGIVRLTNKASRKEQDDIKLLRGHAKVPSETILAAQTNQIRVLFEISHLQRKVAESVRRFPGSNDVFTPLSNDLITFRRWILKYRSLFGAQEIIDTKRELDRLTVFHTLLNAREWIESNEITDVPQCIMTSLASVIRLLQQVEVVMEDQLGAAKRLVEDVKPLVPAETDLGISEEDRLMIVEAMNVQRGHWYKCRRGHLYAIGECGRADEVGMCPECKETIGGKSHQLAEGNAWAPEMDDAEQPPWSEEQDYLFALQLQFQ